ncbi:hypothetical protein OBBRIDRAFT_872234 [Obba rivulosa]|uniref:Uncharacterized protein n=1 Tax=Obba rivulosa TaxID=1052685 RepID=A0A8E2B0Z4_9APHY|nr:hypothetical protein OBBRIDRAFT_872234 [Obba rivulosa]
MAYAVGLHTQHPWIPPQTNFPLKTFRGSDHTVMYIRPSWDDERLLRELKKTYNKLRGFWRKWFSLKNNTHSFIYPQRVGSASVSPHRNLRFRWCLNHPESQGGRYDFMRALTRRADYGIEFVERWQVTRLVIAIVLPLALSLLVAIIYTLRTGDVSSAFTIAGYMTSAYSVFLVLLGILNLVEF